MKTVFLLAMVLAGLGFFKAEGQNAYASKVVRDPYDNGIWYYRVNISAFHRKHPKNMIEIVPDTIEWVISKQVRHLTECEACEINHNQYDNYGQEIRPRPYNNLHFQSTLDDHSRKDWVSYIMISVHDGEAPTYYSYIDKKKVFDSKYKFSGLYGMNKLRKKKCPSRYDRGVWVSSFMDMVMSIKADDSTVEFQWLENTLYPEKKGSIEIMNKEEFFKKFEYDDCHKKKAVKKKQGNSLSK